MLARPIALVMSLAMAGTVASCALVPGQSTFEATFPEAEGRPALTVTVDDRTDLVTDLVIDPVVQPPPPEGVSDDPGGLIVTWLGGACDASVAFVFAPADSGYTLTGTTVTTGDACILIGIERRIQLRLRTPVPAASVDFSMGDRPL